MAGDGYLRKRQIFGNNSATQNVGTADAGPFTLITAKTNYTVFVQTVTIRVTTGSAGVTWSLADSGGTAVPVTGSVAVANAPAEFDVDFGADGMALGAGKNLVLTLSAAGAAGSVSAEAFQKLSAVISQAQAG